MSNYQPAHSPADNASLRPYLGKPIQIELAYVKENGTATNGLWIMHETEENRRRYNEIVASDNPPRTRIECLERAGATFYPHWYQCELERHMNSPTMTTKIAFRKIKNTKENLRLAEEELDNNTLDLEEAQIVEERKTIQWLREETVEDGAADQDGGERAADAARAKSK